MALAKKDGNPVSDGALVITLSCSPCAPVSSVTAKDDVRRSREVVQVPVLCFCAFLRWFAHALLRVSQGSRSEPPLQTAAPPE